MWLKVLFRPISVNNGKSSQDTKKSIKSGSNTLLITLTGLSILVMVSEIMSCMFISIETVKAADYDSQNQSKIISSHKISHLYHKLVDPFSFLYHQLTLYLGLP